MSIQKEYNILPPQCPSFGWYRKFSLPASFFSFFASSSCVVSYSFPGPTTQTRETRETRRVLLSLIGFRAPLPPKTKQHTQKGRVESQQEQSNILTEIYQQSSFQEDRYRCMRIRISNWVGIVGRRSLVTSESPLSIYKLFCV